MPCFMLSLPPELQIAIIDEVEKQDLFAVRLVSRELKAAANDAFLETFFAERAHTFTHRSLNVLLAITTQPHLRAKMRKLSFVVVRTDRVVCEDDEEYRDWLHSDGMWFDCLHCVGRKREGAEELAKTWTQLHRFIARGSIGLLSRSLETLADHHIYPTLGIDDHILHDDCGVGDHSNPYGVHELRKITWKDFTPNFTSFRGRCLPKPDFAISALLRAIALTRYPVQAFFLHGSFDHEELQNFGVIASSMDTLATCFKDLKRIGLTHKVTGCRMLQPLGKLIQNLTTAAASSLTEVRFIEQRAMHLPLGIHSLSPYELFGHCSLRKLEISDTHVAMFDINVETMAKFLNSQPMLEDIRLHHVDFQDSEDEHASDDESKDDESEKEYRPTHLRFIDTLESMNLQHLSLRHWSWQGVGRMAVDYHGKDAVLDGIHRLQEFDTALSKSPIDPLMYYANADHWDWPYFDDEEDDDDGIDGGGNVDNADGVAQDDHEANGVESTGSAEGETADESGAGADSNNDTGITGQP